MVSSETLLNYTGLKILVTVYSDVSDKDALLDYKVCASPVFSFPVQIPYFYAKSWSLYIKVYVLLYKWPVFDS